MMQGQNVGSTTTTQHYERITLPESHMPSKRLIASIMMTTLSGAAWSIPVNVQVSGIASIYPQTDTLTLSFDDAAGATAVPYWLNGFVINASKGGYTGTLSSTSTGYQSPVYIGFSETNVFYVFQECSLSVRCYLGLASPTNIVPSTIDPTISGNLAKYLIENLANLTSTGLNSGWNFSYYTPPNFGESFPYIQTVNPINIRVTQNNGLPISEPSSLALIIASMTSFFALRSNKISPRSAQLC